MGEDKLKTGVIGTHLCIIYLLCLIASAAAVVVLVKWKKSVKPKPEEIIKKRSRKKKKEYVEPERKFLIPGLVSILLLICCPTVMLILTVDLVDRVKIGERNWLIFTEERKKTVSEEFGIILGDDIKLKQYKRMNSQKNTVNYELRFESKNAGEDFIEHDLRECSIREQKDSPGTFDMKNYWDNFRGTYSGERAYDKFFICQSSDRYKEKDSTRFSLGLCYAFFTEDGDHYDVTMLFTTKY